jgi:hypothetical protein
MPRQSRKITHEGRSDSIAGWAAKLGISREALSLRLLAGWPVAEAVTTPRHGRTPKRLRQPQPQQQTQPTPFDELKRQSLAAERQFNSLLRQFNRDLHALMARSLDRGVVNVRDQDAFDRLPPVT